MYEPHPTGMVRFIDDSFTDLCRDLLQHQINFDVVDERSLGESQVRGGKLIVGEHEYDLLVIPPMDTIRTQTIRKIGELVENGGSAFAHPLVPKYAAEGPEKDAEVNSVVERIAANGGFGGSMAGDAPLRYLVKSRVPPECTLAPTSTQILCTSFSRDSSRSFFLVNTASEEYEGWCTLRSFGRASLYDPETGSHRELACEKVDETNSRIALTLPGFASRFVVFR
jgi:hypothetical protein